MTKQDAQDMAIKAIDMLTNEQRKELREKLKNDGHAMLPNNLFFNYETQTWID